MAPVASMRRHTPEPPAGLPQVQFRPGLANETLRELAPLLAEEGIDVDNIDVPDLDTLQQAMNRAVERHHLMRFTPVGVARDDALDVLREVTDAWATQDSDYAGELLDSVPPDAPTGTVRPSPAAPASRSACLTTGCPPAPPRHPPDWADRSLFPPDIGPENAPPPTFLQWPEKAEPAAPSIHSLFGKAGNTSSTAPRLPSPPSSRPGPAPPAHPSGSWQAPTSADGRYHPEHISSP